MMKRLTLRWTLLLALLATIVVAGCSDKGTNNTGNPGGGGGGSRELSSPVLSAGQTYSHTFNAAGVFRYHCGVHSAMKGTITVNAGGSGAQVNVSIQNFTLPSTTVNVGSTVIWTNNDNVPHSVISD